MGRSAAELLKLLPGLTPQLGADNRGGYSGEVTGINGNGEGGKQSAIGNFSGNGTRTDALDITIDGAPGADPGCNCATPVNPNKEFVEEFKVLQSNFGAEHAKGPVTMNVVSKSGGRDFHGSLYSYVRDYHLNSNEWQQNKVGNPRVENKFFFPGGTLSGPLLIPGTDFNKNRDKAFFFVGFEYMKQRLDTGIIRSYVPTQAMRNGDFSGAGSLGLGGAGVGTVPSGYDIVNGVIPSGSDRSRRPGARGPAAPAQRRPRGGQRLQLPAADPGGPERDPAPDPHRLQHQRQHQAVRALQPAARDPALPGGPLVAQPRAGALPLGGDGPQPVRLRRP